MGLFGGLIVWQRAENPPLNINAFDPTTLIKADDMNGQIGDHVRGKEDSSVIVVEYADFQCPGCGATHPYVNQVVEEYGDRVAFVYRNFPLSTIHPNARAAAASAEAAGLQDAYWEMSDKLFDDQSSWNTLGASERTDIFVSYAAELGLDTAQFRKDLTDSRIGDKIKFDIALGEKQKVNATPTFFINGKKPAATATNSLANGDASEFNKLLDEALAQ